MSLSKTMNLVFASTTIILGWTAYSLSSSYDLKQQEFLMLENKNLMLDEKIGDLNKQLLAMEKDVEDYKTQLTTLRLALSKQNQQQLTNQHEEVMARHLLARADVEKLEKTNEQEHSDSSQALLALAKKIQSGKSIADIESSVRERFESEEVDSQWAFEYEDNIRNLVAEDKEQNFQVQELVCKTTACEIKLSADKDRAMLLGTLFSKTIGEQDWRDKGATVIFNHEIVDGAMSILIGRDKNSFN